MRKQLDSKLKNMKPSGNKIKRLKTNDSDVVDENKLSNQLKNQLNGNQNDNTSDNQ